MEKEIFEYIQLNYWNILPMTEEHGVTLYKCRNVAHYKKLLEDKDWNDCTEDDLRNIAGEITIQDIEIYTEDVWEATLEAHAERIYEEKQSELHFLKCPICGQLARTPRAKQARCGHRWE